MHVRTWSGFSLSNWKSSWLASSTYFIVKKVLKKYAIQIELHNSYGLKRTDAAYKLLAADNIFNTYCLKVDFKFLRVELRVVQNFLNLSAA